IGFTIGNSAPTIRSVYLTNSAGAEGIINSYHKYPSGRYCSTMKLNMKIRDIRATTVTVPLEAPLRHANGCHWGRFVRTIVEVETDNGLIGLGEMGGGGETAEAGVRALKTYLVGHDPTRIEEMRFLIANPTAS